MAVVARPGRLSVSDEQVQGVGVQLDADRRQTIHEVGQEIGLFQASVLHILKIHL